MHTKEEILSELQTILSDLFEVDKASIVEDAKLYEDLDLDSIDAIDMIVQLQKMIGKTVKPEDFRSVRTVSDVVDVVHQLIQD
ncbi:Acyl carrier protein (ACP2) [hydrothermal vent metagenome]|uniref:Acyl carrier protein (ACP2) n=1 Tax=hydrothermal vent metagenome TaxID=652676 RepID=A0A3B0X4W6_9ZZZZ